MSHSLQHLKESLKGNIYEPHDAGYDLSKWSENAKLPAKYVALPLETEDVSKIIKFARARAIPLAIRGGGHSTTGASATDGGLLIDLRKMTGMKVDAENKVLHVQGGARIRDIEVETYKHGLAAVVGICGYVGIGGYITGGGLGLSTGKWGLGVDNLLSATVVLADGKIVEASDTENPDLFWGIRGGGSNFGVLAELRLKLHEQRKDIFTFSFVYTVEQLASVVSAIRQWLLEQKETETIYMLMSLGPNGQPCIVVNGASDSDQETGEQLAKQFLDIGPVNVTQSQIPFSVYCTLSDSYNSIPGNKLESGPHVNQFDLETVQKVYSAWLEISGKAPFSAVMYEFYPYDKAAAVPVEATAYAHRSKDITVLAIMAWNDPSLAVDTARDILLDLNRLISSSSSQQAQDSLGYANYADVYSVYNETDEYVKRVFGSNYPRLQKVKREYDPDMVWNRWFAIRPAEV